MVKVKIEVTTKRVFRVNASSQEEAEKVREDLELQARLEANTLTGPVAEVAAAITFVDIRW